ncbi:hypothetical protein BD410DRAFT_806541 [Rickenella mellea]|uniref:Uncharacterized protein n=1 Tax=Rickenella mellea TaxID=50990 RepID=A0A4Y7PT83_9AGAM|nr:hypothetical protein BD410DRAFT_806541 [Rickenella mellea]
MQTPNIGLQSPGQPLEGLFPLTNPVNSAPNWTIHLLKEEINFPFHCAQIRVLSDKAEVAHLRRWWPSEAVFHFRYGCGVVAKWGGQESSGVPGSKTKRKDKTDVGAGVLNTSPTKKTKIDPPPLPPGDQTNEEAGMVDDTESVDKSADESDAMSYDAAMEGYLKLAEFQSRHDGMWTKGMAPEAQDAKVREWINGLQATDGTQAA